MLAGVRQHQQALGQANQEDHLVEPLRVLGGELAQIAAAFGVAHRGDDAAGLVQHERQRGLVELQPAAVDVDHLGGGVHAHALLLDHHAVDPHPAAGDQRLAGAARAETGPGQHLLQTLPALAMRLGGAVVGGGRGQGPPLAVTQAHVPRRREGAASAARAPGAVRGHQAAAPREMSSRAS